MSERYSKLFALPENLYAEGAPLVIAAGALLKDNQTGKVLAQLKFHSISSKEIKAVKVKVTPMDTVSNPLGEKVEYQYLDLTARCSDEFGQKSPIALPNAATRSFSAEVCEVAFADNTVWQTEGEPWEELKKPISISTAIPDHELRKQIKLEYGNSFAYIPATDKDLWICSCGELNHKGEHTCARCRQELSRLLAMDMEGLKAKRDARLAAEKMQAEKDAAQAKARAKKYKKLAVIITPIVVVAIVAAVLISGFVKKNNDYQDAVALLNAGKFDKATSAFEALGSFRDSKDQIENVRIAKLDKAYNEAMEDLENGLFNKAIDAFKELNDYKDSQAQLENAKLVKADAEYQYAVSLFEKGKYDDARAAFEALGEYKDCADYLARYTYTLKGHTYGGRYDSGDSVYSNSEYLYDADGKLAQIITKGTEDELYDETIQFWYYSNGNVKKTVKDDIYSRDSDGALNRRITTRTYSEDGLTAVETIVTQGRSDKEYQYTFDENGNVLTKKDMNAQLESVYTYTFDDDGKLLSAEEAQYNDDGTLENTWPAFEFTYDEDGNLIEKVEIMKGTIKRVYHYTYGYVVF